jgi:hypothetical protein
MLSRLLVAASVRTITPRNHFTWAAGGRSFRDSRARTGTGRRHQRGVVAPDCSLVEGEHAHKRQQTER